MEGSGFIGSEESGKVPGPTYLADHVLFQRASPGRCVESYVLISYSLPLLLDKFP